MTITIRTLRDIAGRYSLAACCDRSRCGHSLQLDVRELIAKLGADFELAELRRRARCSKCGARAPEVRVQMVHDGRPG